MVHQYKNNGYNIVLDVNSGSVHVVDDVVYDVIPLVEKALDAGTDNNAIEKSLMEALKEKYEASDIRDAFEQVMELKEVNVTDCNWVIERLACTSVIQDALTVRS